MNPRVCQVCFTVAPVIATLLGYLDPMKSSGCQFTTSLVRIITYSFAFFLDVFEHGLESDKETQRSGNRLNYSVKAFESEW
jgi:hypothetical protein